MAIDRLEERRGKNALLIRGDFGDDASWEDTIRLASAEYPGLPLFDGMFRANFETIEDPALAGLSIEKLAARFASAGEYDEDFVFYVADCGTMRAPERTIRAVQVGPPLRSFRVTPSAFWAVENNLSIANVDWESFEEALDPDGVYRAGVMYVEMGKHCATEIEDLLLGKHF